MLVLLDIILMRLNQLKLENKTDEVINKLIINF